MIMPTNNLLEANKLKLVKYLSLPKSCRTMPLKRFAREVLGVSEPTVHAWKKDPDVVFATKKAIENNFSNDIPDVMLALRNNALSGNPRAAKIFLEYVDQDSEEVSRIQKRISKEEVEKEIERLTNKFYPMHI